MRKRGRRKLVCIDAQEVGIERLRIEIANRAFEDYVYALIGKVYGRREECNTPQYMIQDCENFFRSNWFRLLYDLDIDAEVVIRELRKRAEEGNKHGRSAIYL